MCYCLRAGFQLFLFCLSNLKPSLSLAPFAALLASGHFLGGISGSVYFIRQLPKGYLFLWSVMVWQTHLSCSDLPEGEPLRISWQMMHQGEEERPCLSAVPVSQRASEEHSGASSISGLSHPAVHLTATAKVMSPSLPFQVDTTISSL